MSTAASDIRVYLPITITSIMPETAQRALRFSERSDSSLDEPVFTYVDDNMRELSNPALVDRIPYLNPNGTIKLGKRDEKDENGKELREFFEHRTIRETRTMIADALTDDLLSTEETPPSDIEAYKSEVSSILKDDITSSPDTWEIRYIPVVHDGRKLPSVEGASVDSWPVHIQRVSTRTNPSTQEKEDTDGSELRGQAGESMAGQSTAGLGIVPQLESRVGSDETVKDGEMKTVEDGETRNPMRRRATVTKNLSSMGFGA